MTSSKPTRSISDSERTVHVLLQHSIDRNRPVIEETLTWLKDHPGRYRRNTAVYSDEQWYHFEVFRYAAALHKIPERLDVVRHFLLHEPKRAYLARVNLPRTEYV